VAAQLATRALLAAAVLCTACTSDGSGEVADGAQDVIGGFPAFSAKLDGIGAVGIIGDLDTVLPVCTGTLVTPTMVLTAEHCIEEFQAEELRFLIGPNAVEPRRVVPVRGVASETLVRGSMTGLGSDIAVLHLAEPVLDAPLVAYAPFEDFPIGRRFSVVGYGFRNNDEDFGARLAGSVALRGTTGLIFEILFGSYERFLAASPSLVGFEQDPESLREAYENERLLDGYEALLGAQALDANACVGDSGGPIIGRVNDRSIVYGVTSWGYGADDQVCALGGIGAMLGPAAVEFVDREAACPMIPAEGACEGNVAVNCAGEGRNWAPETVDCAEGGFTCSFDEDGYAGCVDPCADIPEEGVCLGSAAVRCAHENEGPRRVVATDCGTLGQACGTDLITGETGCVDAP
jgi:secreted trypsin-like serine protease